VVAKNIFLTELGILMISGSNFGAFRKPWEQFFSLLLVWRQPWKLLDFRGYPITRTPGGGANPRPIWHPLNHSKPWLQTCNQQLQDRWLLESNRPEDNSLKISRWYPKPGAVCPWQSGAGGFYISRFANHIFVHRFCFPAKPDSFLRSHLPTTFPDLNIPQQYFPISIFP
jgi:hypothetical protein